MGCYQLSLKWHPIVTSENRVQMNKFKSINIAIVRLDIRLTMKSVHTQVVITWLLNKPISNQSI